MDTLHRLNPPSGCICAVMGNRVGSLLANTVGGIPIDNEVEDGEVKVQDRSKWTLSGKGIDFIPWSRS